MEQSLHDRKGCSEESFLSIRKEGHATGRSLLSAENKRLSAWQPYFKPTIIQFSVFEDIWSDSGCGTGHGESEKL